MTEGFFDLKTPEDLLKKLEREYERLQQHPHDVDMAFNFFVTAEHIPDWLNDIAIKKQHSLLRICSHLANGAKHFEPTRHSAVSSTGRQSMTRLTLMGTPGARRPRKLQIHLTSEESTSFGQSLVDVLMLAERVFDFWKNHKAFNH